MVLMQTRSRLYSTLQRSVCMLRLLDTSNGRATQRVLPIIRDRRFFQTSGRILEDKEPTRALTLYSFENVNKKEKETFLDVIHMYESQEPMRRGHVDFIKAAMNYMDEFGVNEDLEVYKKLIDVMPKGRFISTSPLVADFMYHPKQQQCIIDLLEKMEGNGVIPDLETQQMLLNIFGQFGIPLRKFWRMMYWMPKFRHLNPWPTPRPVPTDSLILARLAIEKISSVDAQSVVTVYRTEDVADSVDKTWVVSASSPEQSDLLRRHPENTACYVEGPFKIWVAHMPVDYFILRGDAHVPPPDDDFDEDGKIVSCNLLSAAYERQTIATVHLNYRALTNSIIIDNSTFAHTYTGKCEFPRRCIFVEFFQQIFLFF